MKGYSHNGRGGGMKPAGPRSNRPLKGGDRGYGHKGTMGSGQVKPYARGTMGSGEVTPRARGVQGRGG